jgi:flagellar hook-length control protein FliK
MSSLRISHQNRTIGATAAGGDTGRSEHADDRSSFAAALGVAGAAPKGATTFLGGQTGEASPGPADLRKRADAAGKLNDAASLAAQAALAPPVNADAPRKPDEKQEKPASSVATAGQDVLAANVLGSAVTAADPAIASAASNAVGQVPGGSVNPLAAAAAPTAGIIGDSIDPLAATGAAVEVRSGIPILQGAAPDNAATARTGAEASPQLAFPPPAPTASGAASQVGRNVPARPALALVAPQPLPGQAQAAPAAPSDAATAVVPGAVASATAIATLAPTPGPVVAPAGQSADLASLVAPSDTPTDAIDAGSPLSSALAPSPSASQVTSSLLASLSPSLPSMGAGQPSTGGAFGAPFGAQTRDRFAPVGAMTDATSTGAAAALDSVGGTAALAAAPTVTPGSVADASVGGAISDQVAGHLVRLVSSGSSDMVMRLHPPELGDLTIRVTVSGHDVSAWFTSPQPEVQNAISAAIGQLQTDLGTAGYNLNGAWVGADASGAQQQSAQAPTPLPLRTPSTAASLALPAAVASRPAASGLNIYV